MIKVTDIAGGVALDPRSLNSLRKSSTSNSPEAIRKVANQMEGLFVDMVLKSMRKASPQEGPLDNEQTRLFSAMLDSQMSQHVHTGLADVVIKQLSKATIKPPQSTTEDAIPSAAEDIAAHLKERALSKSERVEAFFSKLAPFAEQASQATGIPAQFMLSHAALESGWGKHEILAADGTTSHNLFGIKASKKWTGRTVDCMTTEYTNGVAHKQVEKFRAYDSYAEAFEDYANLLRNNPRYQNVVANSHDSQEFAYGLQRAGYATDPHYGAKLVRIIRQMDTAQASLDIEAKVF